MKNSTALRAKLRNKSPQAKTRLKQTRTLRRILVCLRSSEAVWKVGLVEAPGFGVAHVLYALKTEENLNQQETNPKRPFSFS